MATRTITLTPEATSSSNWTRTGGSTQHGVITDASDSTYIEGDPSEGVGGDPSIAYFDLTAAPLSGFISAVRFGLRHKCSGGALQNYEVGLGVVDWLDSPFRFIAGATVTPTTTITSVELEPTSSTYMRVARQSQIDAAQLFLLSEGDSEGAFWLIYEAYVEVDVDEHGPGAVWL